MLGVGCTRGLLLIAWNALIGGSLLVSIEEVHAEKENGQESQKPGYDSPITPRHGVPP